MRPLSLLLATTALAACAVKNPGTPPDTKRFYYPTGIAWQSDSDGGGPGFIYVVSSDFDLRFNRGTVAAVDVAILDTIIDGTFTTLPDGGPVVVGGGRGATPLHSEIPFISSLATIDPFGGPLATFTMPSGGTRLFVAGRESGVLQGIDANGPSLTCAQPGVGNDCFTGSVLLANSQINQARDAYRPLVTSDGLVYVSHITPIDHPYGSNTNYTADLAIVSATQIGDGGQAGFVQLGPEASDGLAQVGRQLYIGGRAFSNDPNTTPLRRLDLDEPGPTLVTTSLTVSANVIDGRAMAASSDGSRLYLVIRDPDGLLTLDMTPGADGVPSERVLNEVQLPPGADEIAIIPRGPGRRDIVAVTCADDGSVALYDDDLEVVEKIVHGVGSQPFGVAAGVRAAGGGARLYVAAFGQGNVAVIDLPSLDDLTQAQVLLTIGPDENCLSDDLLARPPGCPQ